MFTHAIVRIPGPSIVEGLTSANLGKPVYEHTIKQHAAYIDALHYCGLSVTILDPDDAFPDSTFVEDTALLTPSCAIITNPGAPSRRGEIDSIKDIAHSFYKHVENIHPPGTVEAGDILMAGTHFFIGLSKRTNKLGAEHMMAILQSYGFTASTVQLKNVLHLKTGVAYLEHNNLVACGEFVNHPAFRQFNILEIEKNEAYAANCLWINNKVLVAAGFPKAKRMIEDAGYETIELDMSEFQKVDGGLSCLSLRF